jgi:hypothetical protein
MIRTWGQYDNYKNHMSITMFLVDFNPNIDIIVGLGMN